MQAAGVSGALVYKLLSLNLCEPCGFRYLVESWDLMFVRSDFSFKKFLSLNIYMEDCGLKIATVPSKLIHA